MALNNQELKKMVKNYSGNPFLVGEMAKEAGVSWGRMSRLMKQMVVDGDLRVIQSFGASFYQVVRPGQ